MISLVKCALIRPKYGLLWELFKGFKSEAIKTPDFSWLVDMEEWKDEY